MAYSSLSIRDKGSEIGRHRLNHDVITVGNLAAFLTDWGTYKGALDAITLGVLAREIITMDNTLLSGAIPASNFAQRETKLLISYFGNTSNRPRRFELPSVDLAALTLVNNTDQVLLADGGVMAAYVAAAETLARMSDAPTETITITGAKVIGRNT